MDANHNNRYPSPPSSTNSPNITEERVTPLNSSILRRATISAVSEASQETQRHLQQTSAALDAAYNRIYQVRRSLLDLSETLPETLSQLRLHTPEDQSTLGHDADTLSLPPNFESLSASGLLERRDARERAPWNRVRPGSRNDRLSPDAVNEGFSQPAADQSQVGTALSLSGNTLRSFTRMRANPPSRAAVQGDDGSTLLGRRVAARMANAPTIADAPSATNQLMGDIGRIYEGAFNSIASVTRNYEDELESVRHIMNERRQTSSAVPLRSTPSQTLRGARSPSQGLPQLSPHPSQGTPQSSSESQESPDSSLNPQWDLGPGNVSNNARQNSGPSERLSLLSNFSVQNLPTPSTSNLPSRPLIFDEPLSYVPPETVNPPSESRYPPPESAFQGRNYVVHRTYDRNGEELVHNITVDWDDGDPMSWLMPSPVTSRRPRNRFSSPRRNLDVLRNMDPPPPPPPPQETTNTTNSNDLPRRRGWARLDLDGNEIPSDEEEEVERIRTESRMRASQRTQTLSSISLPGNTPAPPPRELNIYQNIKPPVVLRHDPSLSYPADFVNPLPMPLSEMVDSGEKPKRQATLLPRHIIVAGR